MEALVLCIALNVWHEARGEEYQGQLAVAEVTRRRMQDPRWPSSACEVVYQPWQFEWTAKYGSLEDTPVPSPTSPSWLSAIKAARESVDFSVTTCADHFYNPRFVAPAWDKDDRATVDVTVGGHRFLCVSW